MLATVLVFAAGMVVTRTQPGQGGAVPGAGLLQRRVLWMLLEAEFLAIVLVLVYVGAVMVLFLFVVMMLDIDLAQHAPHGFRYLPVGLLRWCWPCCEMALVLKRGGFGTGRFPDPASAVGLQQHQGTGPAALHRLHDILRMWPHLILLVAIIAAIALTMRRRPTANTMNPADQVRCGASKTVPPCKIETEGECRG